MHTCFKILCFLFSLILTQGALAEPVQYIQLYGSFFEMGYAYADKVSNTLVKQLALIKKELPPKDPVQREQFEKEVKQFIQIAKKRYPNELYDFLHGMSHRVEADHLTFDDLVYMDNLMFFIKFAQNYNSKNSAYSSCSFIGLRESSVVVGRNYDFPRKYINLMTTYPMIVRLEHKDKKLYPNAVTAVSFAGGISAATFMNDRGHYISINSGTNTLSDKEFMVFQRPSYVGNMLLTMMKVPNFISLHRWVETTSPDYPYIVNIAGPEYQQLYSVESSAYNVMDGEYPPNTIPDHVFKARTRGPQSTKVTEPDQDYNIDMLVATNTFHLLNWEPYLGHPIEKLVFSYERYQNLINLGRSRQDSDASTMMKIMERELNTQQIPQGATVNYCGTDAYYDKEWSATYYSVVFDTHTKSLAVRFQQNNKEDTVQGCSSQWSDWVKIRG